MNTNSPEVIKLEWAKEDELIKDRLLSMPSVYIWSGEHNAYWRPNSSGYTVRIGAVGVYSGEEAFQKTSHCDPSKMIEFEEVCDLK
jgi:hypothetical protein